jgi:serine/threonine protein kinase
MVTGENPFFCDGMDQVSLYDTICSESMYPLTDDRSESLVNFVEGLLEKDPMNRLGMLAGGVDDLFQHPWLDGLDLQKIRAKEWPSPWKTPQADVPKILEAEKPSAPEMNIGIGPLPLDDSYSSLNDKEDAWIEEIEDLWVDESPSKAEETNSLGSIQEMEEVWVEDDNSMGSIQEDKETFLSTEKETTSDTSIGSITEGEEAEGTSTRSSRKSSRKKKKKKTTTKKHAKKLPTVGDFVDGIERTDSQEMSSPGPAERYLEQMIKSKSRTAARTTWMAKKKESSTRKQALRGALRNVGVCSDDDDEDFQKFLSS